jgi:hypothetical protein
MKVFISWSGSKSRAIALKLREWLPSVIQSVKPWMSSADIDAGGRWDKYIANELEETKFGIICLTKSNQTAPWILFEAGALAKTVEDTFVCPYLIDLEPLDVQHGPLSQFQAKRADEKETLELLYTINKALRDSNLTNEQLKKTFDLWWPELKTMLEATPTDQSGKSRRPVEDMIEEILDLTRELSRNSTRGKLRSTLEQFGIDPRRFSLPSYKMEPQLEVLTHVVTDYITKYGKDPIKAEEYRQAIVKLRDELLGSDRGENDVDEKWDDTDLLEGN